MEYVLYEGIPKEEHVLQGIIDLHSKVFGNYPEIIEELNSKHRSLVLLAMEEASVVGYKLGFERKPNKFYSWLGGVDPNYRNKGIASELTKRQHYWCRENGYDSIRTHTKNKWREMLILNIRHGFDVIGTFTDDKGEPKLILEKKFTSFLLTEPK